MINSVDGSNAVPQTTGDNASVGLASKKTSSLKAYGDRTAKNNLKNNFQGGDFGVSDVNNQLNTGYNGVVIKDNSKFNSLEQKLKNKENSEDLVIEYGNRDEDEEETYFSKDTSYIPTSFLELAAMVGSNTASVTKEQLTSYLDSLTESGASASAAEITVVKNLIAQFDVFSGGTGIVTSLDGLGEAQDYTTITKEQVTSPVDIRI